MNITETRLGELEAANTYSCFHNPTTLALVVSLAVLPTVTVRAMDSLPSDLFSKIGIEQEQATNQVAVVREQISERQIFEALHTVYSTLVSSQEGLDDDDAREILHKNLWDLYV